MCPVSQSASTRGTVTNAQDPLPNIRQGLSAQQTLNSTSLKDLRKKMVNGQDVSETCSRCLFEEANSLVSRRQLELGRFPHFTESFVSQWTESDGSLKSNSPVSMVILRLGNKCNLACRMCGPSSSSAWYKEWLETRHRGFKEDDGRVALEKKESGAVVAHPNPYDWTEGEKPLDFISSCGADLERLHFSGGEPLLVKGHLDILKNLVQSGRAAGISLEYNSNLTVLTDEVLGLWTHFKFVEIGISMDGPPEVNEYIRYPLRSNIFLANLQKLDRSVVKGRFWLSATVQIYNLLYLPEMIEWVKAQKFTKISSEISWHVLRAPKELSIFALPRPMKEVAAAKLKNRPEFADLAETLFVEDESAHFAEFLSTTQKMDQYRGQNVRQLTVLWGMISAYSPN